MRDRSTRKLARLTRQRVDARAHTRGSTQTNQAAAPLNGDEVTLPETAAHAQASIWHTLFAKSLHRLRPACGIQNIDALAHTSSYPASELPVDV
eukprot:6190470-Pleurochrysis_carterae.AAC.2